MVLAEHNNGLDTSNTTCIIVMLARIPFWGFPGVGGLYTDGTMVISQLLSDHCGRSLLLLQLTNIYH